MPNSSADAHPLHDLHLPGPTLVLVDDTDSLALDALRGIEDIAGLEPEIVASSDLTQPRRGWGSVLVVAGDRARLRRMAAGLPPLGQCRAIACWLTDVEVPWVLVPRPEWPPLFHLAARTTGERGVLTVTRFSGGARAQLVVMEMARQASGPGATAHGGLVVSYAGRSPAPGLDPRAVVLAEAAEAADEERDVPPDVVVTAGTTAEIAVHPVIDRAPTVVSDAGPEPVDERVFNPMGFQKRWTQPIVDLADLAQGPVTEAVVARARDVQAVRLDAMTPLPDLLALAMAGVPLVSDPLPDAAASLATPLRDALSAEVDLDDPLRREEHSLAVRRAAFDHHSTLAWRSRLAARAEVRHVGLPPVSVLLTTRRPEMLEFAVRQVARQRGADIELVVAAHGFDPDRDVLRRHLSDRSYHVLVRDSSELFGDVLTAASGAASADVMLKIDDDDWYSPDAVHDLLMARRYSGADVVGMPHEYVYLDEADVTVRRTHPTELFARFVAGGTLLIDRSMLRAVGDFRRVRRFVDAQLLAGVEAAGGRIYRTHGLGYVLRRMTDGHTWDFPLEEFRRAEILDTEWPGFVPSRAMEVLDEDHP